MTIKRRLAVSNVLMILVPVVVTILIALCCVGVIWFTIARGTGVGFEDSEDFYQASTGITELVAEGLKSNKENEQLESLQTLTSFLDRGAISLLVTADGGEFYRYGEAGSTHEDAQLILAAQALDNEGTLSVGARNLHAHALTYNGTDYVIYLYNTQSQLSYTSLKVALAIAGSVLLLAILLSVFFTDRFLTRFVFRHIEGPLEMLVGGVHQISDGNLDYRLEYKEKDEFLPICQDFNDMAERLKDSVERSRREEE
ncbi:MAG: HAMP domain-containing protein, partial [Oscillospiraceae bacterium]|nr:HAMP domain-containing protein [Oscillospiraceae bacterium]